MSDPRIGTRLGPYAITGLLGRGGMGVVYLAEHLPLERTVALKVLTPELAREESFRERFVRESKLAAGLHHPNIVPVYDAGEESGLLYLAMHRVEGSDLKEVVRSDGALEPARAVDIIEQVAGALDAAHARGLVHRDVKPANVLLDGASTRVYLSDFGLTKRTQSAGGLTRTGQFVGTLDYIAPEQIESKDVDGRADVYSLGCVAYEVLTGRLPFTRDSDVGVLWAHIREMPQPPSTVRPGLGEAVDVVMARAMAKSPDDRYQTAGAFATDLRSAVAAGAGRVTAVTTADVDRPTRGTERAAPTVRATEPPPVLRERAPERVPAAPKRLTRRLLVASVVLLGLAGGAARVLTLPDRPPGPTPTPDLAAAARAVVPPPAPDPGPSARFGIIVATNSPRWAKLLNAAPDTGVAVLFVIPDGPAAVTPLRRGDVITAVDGRPTPNDERAILLGLSRPNERHTLSVVTPGRERTSIEIVAGTPGTTPLADLYKPLIDRDTSNPVLRFLRGRVLGDHGAAFADLDGAIAVEPGFVEAHLERADRLWASSGERGVDASHVATLRRQAMESYDRALADDPRFAEGLAARSITHARLGNAKAAREDAENAVESDPMLGLAQNALAEAFLGLGMPEAAAVPARKAVDLNPYRSRYYATLAKVFVALGRLDDARRTVEAVLPIETDPALRALLEAALATPSPAPGG